MLIYPETPQEIAETPNLLAGIILELAPQANLSMQMDGSCRGLCPFHDDHEPSFHVYRGDDRDRWKCWACSQTGDVFDFIQQLQGVGFVEAKNIAKTFRDSGKVPDLPEITRIEKADPKELQARLDFADHTDMGVLPELIIDRGMLDLSLRWIRDEWRVRDDRIQVYVPHYDSEDKLIGLKLRYHLDWIPMAVLGSDLSNLYGTWRDSGAPNVVLCEGESDTWLVSFLLRDTPTVVLGLPHGVSPPTSTWIKQLTGREVTLLFDADPAGRSAIRSWVDNAPLNLKVAILPDGSDCNTAGKDQVLQAIADALPWNDTSNLTLTTVGNKYANVSVNGINMISDFTFEVKRSLVMPQNVVYEVEIPTKGILQQLNADDLASTNRLRTWAAKRMLSWRGSDKNVGEMIEILKSQSILVPQVKGVDIVGLHDNVFVLPDSVIGSSGWGYIHPESDIHLGEFLHIQEGSWDLQALDLMSRLHTPSVITPILGWIAAAPLRSLFRQFPILSVTGGSGWGKTTILRECLKSFGFWVKSPPTLTGSTPHAILSYASSTNAIPIWFDEYRPGARIEARQTLDQVMRDAFDGSATIKGGLENNRMNVKRMPACAPLIVSGEDAFTETSHVERMVSVSLPKDGKGIMSLINLRKCDRDGLGYSYLSWLLDQLRSDSLPRIPDLTDRSQHSIAVADWGYRVLSDYSEVFTGQPLDIQFDGGSVKAMQRQVANRPVILEAIELTIGLQDSFGQYISYLDPNTGIGYVKPQSLVRWASTASDIKLPGGSRAVSSWLKEMYGAVSVNHLLHRRCLEIPNLAKLLEGINA